MRFTRPEHALSFRFAGCLVASVSVASDRASETFSYDDNTCQFYREKALCMRKCRPLVLAYHVCVGVARARRLFLLFLRHQRVVISRRRIRP